MRNLDSKTVTPRFDNFKIQFHGSNLDTFSTASTRCDILHCRDDFRRKRGITDVEGCAAWRGPDAFDPTETLAGLLRWLHSWFDRA